MARSEGIIQPAAVQVVDTWSAGEIVTVIAAIVVTGTIALLAWQWRERRRKVQMERLERLYSKVNEASRAQQQFQEQRDMLYEMTTKVQRATSLEESLARIVELAPLALGADFAVVFLASPDELEVDDERWLRVAAITRLEPPLPVSEGQEVYCPNSRRAMRLAKPVTVEDASCDAALKAANVPGLGSALYLPLIGKDSQTVGTLVMLRRRKGPFDDELVRLAELFSARAAVVIENTRLREQAVHDAQMKATLLNELNHRVKNNLAGIVGLLSIGKPPLSTEAQRWVDRVVDRISAMARAHELFTARRQVTVRQLVETTLDSIGAITPSDVRVTWEMDESDALLKPERAIPLAMVIHELAYNAAVHGLDAAGHLTVRVSSQPGVMTIEIIDDGRQLSAMKDRHAAVNGNGNGNGMGLELVRGLVLRELRGTFELLANRDGGSCARVTFPIEPGTAEGDSKLSADLSLSIT